MFHAVIATLSYVFVFFVICASSYITGFALLGIDRCLHFPVYKPQTRFLVLVPAHNEAGSIEPTLRSLQRADYPEELIRIAVIADNCSDNTAEVARSCGVEAWIRTDSKHSTKGHALYWAFDKAALPYDLATIMDADTEVDPGFFTAMNAAYAASLQKGRAAAVLQGRYLYTEMTTAASGFDPFVIASKAAENSFSYRPRTALGLANLIQRTGFSISRAALEQVPYQASTVLEEAKYAIELALQGIPVTYVDEARVTSRVTERLKNTASERLVWTGDIFPLLRHPVPDLLRASVGQRRWKLAEMALMLVFTSRLLLVYATLISFVLLDFVYRFRYYDLAASALAVSVFLQAIYLYLTLRKADTAQVPIQQLFFMPIYVSFLGAMQLGAFLRFSRRKGLNRTIWSG
jgi:1,2-diacylglycerol 3-beta-glucosyltransferase